MNSKYAPVVALTAVVILIVVALGWFLAIKPGFSEASNIKAKTDEVNANVSQIQLETSKLAKYEQELAAAPALDDTLALNLPSIVDVGQYIDRINAAVASSGVELVSLDMNASYLVTGWEVPATARTSTSIAKLFTTGPIAVSSEAAVEPAPSPTGEVTTGGTQVPAGAYTPPVVASVEAGPVVQDLQGLPFEIQVTGSYSETVKFLARLTAPDAQIFLLSDLTQIARNEGSAFMAGVSNASDGDVITTVTGSFFFLNPDSAVVDDDVLAPVKPAQTSPFAPSKAVAAAGN